MPSSFVFAETDDESFDTDGVIRVEPEIDTDTPEDKRDEAKDDIAQGPFEVLLPITRTEDEMTLPNIIIASYNPGFSDPYIGEFMELKKLPNESILLAGLSIIYETSSGSEYTVLDFSEEYEMVGESLLLRLMSSEEVKAVDDPSSVADITYTRNMSQTSGRIKLSFQNEIIDSLCWGIKEVGCYDSFKAGKKNQPTTLVRKITEEEVDDFDFVADYVPTFDPLNPGLKVIAIQEETVEPQCRTIEFMELYTYYNETVSEQFIEIFNRGEETTNLDGCYINYKNNNYPLNGGINAKGFRVFYVNAEWGISMTKNPISSNKLTIIDTDGEIVDMLTYYNGQRKGVSLAKVKLEKDEKISWAQTYYPTPGEENVYQEFKTCPTGKVINLETGNCVNEAVPVTTLAACPDGKYRNPLTGRCKSYVTTASASLKPCAEGYERNPATGRCRKIIENNGASFPIASGSFEERTEFTAAWAIGAVVMAGLGYIAFQYKDEIRSRLHPNKKALG